MTFQDYKSLPEAVKYAVYQAFIDSLNLGEKRNEFILHVHNCADCRKKFYDDLNAYIEQCSLVKYSEVKRALKASLN